METKYISNTQFVAASILLSNNCNLACKYCYRRSGRGNETLPLNMSIEMGIKAIDFLIEGALAVKEKNKENNEADISLMFFGGEPTLNISTMRDMFDYAYNKCNELQLNFKCQIITNCTIWNDKLEDFLNHWFDTMGRVDIQLSIDGCPEELDHDRPSSDDTFKTSEVLKKTALQFMEWEKNKGIPNMIYAHACISKFSLPYAKESFDYIRDILGIERIWFMPIHEEDWDNEDVIILEEQYGLIADRILNDYRNDGSKDHFNNFVSFEFRAEKSQLPCGAGTTFLTFDTDGTIYPCHKFKYPEDKRLILGHIDKGIDPLALDYFKDVTIVNYFGIDNCGDCKQNSCRICMAQNYEHHGDLRQGFPKYCQLSLKEDEIRWKLKGYLEDIGIYIKVPVNDSFAENEEIIRSPEKYCEGNYEDYIKDYVYNTLLDYTNSNNKDLTRFKNDIKSDIISHQEKVNTVLSSMKTVLENMAEIISTLKDDIDEIKKSK